jgi:hypothetical protein
MALYSAYLMHCMVAMQENADENRWHLVLGAWQTDGNTRNDTNK